MIGLFPQIFLSSLTILACLNTSFSRTEEKQITNETIHLINGQFPEHGKAFYKQQVESCRNHLSEDPKHLEFRNDLAAALIKLGRFEEALEEFSRIQQQHPGLYKTQANLGVLFKKRKQFDRAAEHIRQSLKIRPQGHLGLGDYYLRMLRWRDRLAQAQEGRPEINFLGLRYDAGPEEVARSSLVNRTHLETLIKADRHFPDTYLILGDLLLNEGEEQLALRAYWRANTLDHPAPGVVRERIHSLYQTWKSRSKQTSGYIVEPRHQMNFQLTQELGAAVHWVQKFQEVEAELLARGQEVDYQVVKNELTRRGVEKATFLHAGFVKGTSSSPGTLLFWILGMIAVIILAGMIAVMILALTGVYRVARFTVTSLWAFRVRS